jgi:gamma-glutamylcyclotransferase (GGCT)/AIG2-like uncharacterized protein YtfP
MRIYCYIYIITNQITNSIKKLEDRGDKKRCYKIYENILLYIYKTRNTQKYYISNDSRVNIN